MKWLKKNSSDNEQLSTAESQPEPKDVSHAAGNKLHTEPGTLEQPDKAGKGAMPNTMQRHTGRRRSEKIKEEAEPSAGKGKALVDYMKSSWVAKNWKTFAILMVIFAVAFYARAYYGLTPATEDGIVLSGGSDSYYYHYIIDHGSNTGEHLFWEDMLNYPIGTRNPRSPLFSWSTTLGGAAASPFFGGDLYIATLYVFIFSTAFWGALTIFPTYLIGKEAFGKKTGIIAAFLLAILPSHVLRSVLTNADHDAMVLFIMVTSFYFFLKALKSLQVKEWISNWQSPKEVFKDSKEFFRSNRVTMLYSVLAGLSIAGVALAWQGFAYAIVLISVYFLAQIFINRFRNIDSFGVFVIYFISVGTGLLLAFPYYYQSIQIPSWFDTPTYLFLALSGFALVLMITRKYPWFLVFSSIAVATLITTIVLRLLAPSVLDTMVNALLSGGGYFINNKQYQTIAEAQAPPFSNLALSFGVFTFWLSFIGVAWAAIQLPKSWKPDFTFILLWSGTSIYMAVSAARFMFNAAPAFALTAGWVLALIMSKLNLKKYISSLKRASKPNMTTNLKLGLLGALATLLVLSLVLTTFSNVAYHVFVVGLTAIIGVYMLNLIAETNPNKLYNLATVLIPASAALFYILAEFYTDWQLNDASHVFILAIMLLAYIALYLQVRKISFFFTGAVFFMAFCIVAPNVWAGLDTGIPYETKSDYDKQIYHAMPVFMQPSEYDAINGSNWYLGSFGYSLPLNSRYWPAAYSWLAEQDADIYPDHNKPAFLSWWDYGFEVVNQGRHPTVADNFLGGHQLAGNFIMAQSEKDAIALLCVRILEGNRNKYWFGQPDSFDPEVVQVLEAYGIDVDKLDHIFDNPSQYTDIILNDPELYGPRDDDMQDINARYIATRVLLTQAMDEMEMVSFYDELSIVTGHSIRYFGIDSRLFPFSAQNTGIFYAPAKLSDHRISDVANQPYDFWEIKAVGEFGGEYDLDNVPPDVRLDRNAPYKIAYKEMFYNTMLYKAFVGYSGYDIGQGEAGIPGVSGSLEQNPIMPGWNMSHFKLVHRTAYWNPYSMDDIMNHTDAWRAMEYWDAYEKQQAGDGISDLSDRSSLYQGVMMLKYYHGAIISGQVILEDGTPIAGVSVTVSDDFNIPHQRVVTDDQGRYSIIAPPGEITLTASTGAIDPLRMMGTEINMTMMFIDDYQAMRSREDRDNDGKYDYLIDQDLVVNSARLTGTVYWDIEEYDEYIGNAKIMISNNDLTFESETISDAAGQFVFENLPPGNYDAAVTYANRTIGTHNFTLTVGERSIKSLPMMPTTLRGTITFFDDTPARGAEVRVWLPEEGLEFITVTDANGTYEFDNVLFGQVYAQARIGNYASSVMVTDIEQFSDNTLNFMLFNSAALEGTVKRNGIPVPHATIKFVGTVDTLVTADSRGHYSVSLVDGYYIYFVTHALAGTNYVAMGRFYSGEDSQMDILLDAGCLVSGNVINSEGFGVPNTPIVFEHYNSGIIMSAHTDSLGDYTISVPQGLYRVQISSEQAGSYYAEHDIRLRTIRLNITTRPAEPVIGTIFWDIDGDGNPSSGEALNEVRVTFTEPTGAFAQAITGEDGTFSIFVPPSSYRVSLTKTGFHSVDLGVLSYEEQSLGIYLDMDPIIIPVEGRIHLGQEILTGHNILLEFDSQIDSQFSKRIQVGRDGFYSSTINPGTYIVSFTHNLTSGNDSVVYQIREDLFLDSGFYDGRTLSFDLEAVLRAKITIQLEGSQDGANITFKDGPEERMFDMPSETGEFYLIPGNYVVSAVHSSEDNTLVNMGDITVLNQSNYAALSMRNGINLVGNLRFGNRAIPHQRVRFDDMDSNGSVTVTTDFSGNYDVILLPETRYQARVNFTDYDVSPHKRAYRYYSTDGIIDTRVPLSNHVINLERVDHLIRLDVLTTADGSAAPSTHVRLISGFGNHTFTTDRDGESSIDLIPGEYVMYAYHGPSRHTILHRVTLGLEQESLEIPLIPGKRVYGTAYYEMNLNAVTELAFNGSDGKYLNINTDDFGYYDIWLPPGTYTVSSELKSVRNDIDVVYTLDREFELSEDRQLNLPLTMNEERIVFVSFDPHQFKEVPANTTVKYTFEVENMGNIRDTYQITATGATPLWVTELSSTEVTVNPGSQNTALLTVTTIIPPDTKINENRITITATSMRDPTIRHSNAMNLDIKPVYSFEIQPSATPPIFSMGEFNSQFAVLNKGNGEDIFTLYIANNEELSHNGWVVEFAESQGAEVSEDGRRITNVSATSGTAADVPLVLTPVGNSSSRNAQVMIIGYSQMDDSVFSSSSIVLSTPTLQASSGNLTVTGEDVSPDRFGSQLTNVGVMAISVASALLVFYYARKKRWIR